MARPDGLSDSQIGVVRSATAAIAQENTTLTDANFPTAQALDCAGFETILVGVEVTGGTNPTMLLEVLVRDPDAADGQRWKRLLAGAPDGVTATAAQSVKTPALASGASLYEVRVFGRVVMLRIDAVTNEGSTTAWKILAMPGKRRR